jgi:hypothetical protein
MPRYPVEPAWETVVRRLYSAFVAAHVQTTRWTYTVPGGRFAIVQHAFVLVDLSAVDNQLIAQIESRDSAGATNAIVVGVISLTTRREVVVASPHLVLDEGEQLVGHTLHIDAIPRLFSLSAHIIEVVK